MNNPETLTREIRDHHVALRADRRDGSLPDNCAYCDEPWPCPAALAADQIESDKTRLRELEEALELARPVLEYVSYGRGYSGTSALYLYPDATARKALGRLNDLGLRPIESTNRGTEEGA